MREITSGSRCMKSRQAPAVWFPCSPLIITCAMLACIVTTAVTKKHKDRISYSCTEARWTITPTLRQSVHQLAGSAIWSDDEWDMDIVNTLLHTVWCKQPENWLLLYFLHSTSRALPLCRTFFFSRSFGRNTPDGFPQNLLMTGHRLSKPVAIHKFSYSTQYWDS